MHNRKCRKQSTIQRLTHQPMNVSVIWKALLRKWYKWNFVFKCQTVSCLVTFSLLPMESVSGCFHQFSGLKSPLLLPELQTFLNSLFQSSGFLRMTFSIESIEYGENSYFKLIQRQNVFFGLGHRTSHWSLDVPSLVLNIIYFYPTPETLFTQRASSLVHILKLISFSPTPYHLEHFGTLPCLSWFVNAALQRVTEGSFPRVLSQPMLYFLECSLSEIVIGMEWL